MPSFNTNSSSRIAVMTPVRTFPLGRFSAPFQSNLLTCLTSATRKVRLSLSRGEHHGKARIDLWDEAAAGRRFGRSEGRDGGAEERPKCARHHALDRRQQGRN